MIAMILLLVLTIMGLSGMRTANLQEHFAGNLRDKTLSFGAAETALRFAEEWIQGQTSKPSSVSSCSSAPCDLFESFSLENGYYADKAVSWWDANGRDYDAPGTVADLARIYTQPKFIIEESSFSPDSLTTGVGVPTGRTFYRVSALGQGGSMHTKSIIQTTYAKRFN